MDTTADRLLTELERQQKYLSELPDNFEYPLFNVNHAVESQRASGYRTTAAASREIIDNAVEAGATRVDVVFDESMDSGRTAVSSVAFIDDGPGMLPQMARYALTWGGGTHFDHHDFIGKFGFGLPNSSINQTRLVEVYTRTSPREPIFRATLDIRSVSRFGVQSIPEPEPAALPGFVDTYLKRKKVGFDHGTVVVWVRPDRLSYKRPAKLKEHMIDDFGVTYRYMLRNERVKPDGLLLRVLGQEVEPVDPMFLLPGARLYLSPAAGGAEAIDRLAIPVRYSQDAESGEWKLTKVEDNAELEEAANEGDILSAVTLTVSRMRPEFVALNGADEDAKRRFEIRKSHRGMSFVRAGREIQTLDSFPHTKKAQNTGLGVWPLLQSYAYNWGIEVRFGPELDEVLGVTNDKQSVRPSEDFWRVLVEAEVDAAARRENAWQREQRKRAPAPPPVGVPSDGELAAKLADSATGQRPVVPSPQRHSAQRELDKAAKRTARDHDGDVDAARAALEAEAARRPYKVDFRDRPDGPWFEPDWIGNQLVVWVNRQHQFYQVLYGDLLRTPGAARAKQAMDVLLIALAKAEKTVDDEEIAVALSSNRRYMVTPFLESGLAALAGRMPVPEEATVAGEEDVPNADVETGVA